MRSALESEEYRNVSYLEDPEVMIDVCRLMRVDLLLLELGSADCGLSVMRALTGPVREGRLEVIVITDEADLGLRYLALGLGARDFIRRPIDRSDVALRVRNSLAAHALHCELRERNHQLATVLTARSHELAGARQEVLAHLAVATEFRDDETGEHTERVGRTAAQIAAGCGLDRDLVGMIRIAAPLHDVGKIGIPDTILLKAGRLTPSELDEMQTHTRIGAAILAGSAVPERNLAETIARSHHERWDGSGYPDGLSGMAIPVAARIVAIADVFDALVFERPYKPAWPLDAALSEIRGQRGRHFDATLVDVFLGLHHERLMAPIHSTETGRVRQTLQRVAAGTRRSLPSFHGEPSWLLPTPLPGSPIEVSVGIRAA